MLQFEVISFQGTVDKLPGDESLSEFTYTFKFGKSYLLNGLPGSGAAAISWLAGGAITPDSGTMYLNDVLIQPAQLRDISWLVRRDTVKQFGLFTRSVKSQIQRGLQKYPSSYSVQDIKEHFKLTEDRYTRKLRQLSHEAWSASCAIGFAHAKKIFCFPHIDHYRPGLIREYRTLWLENNIQFLTDNGALVLCPAPLSEDARLLFDKIIHLTDEK
jgi:hypothetical protein